ncbi:MAG: hypothetical protein ABIT47_03705 [Candidatus Paceibacterota bacterium]
MTSAYCVEVMIVVWETRMPKTARRVAIGREVHYLYGGSEKKCILQKRPQRNADDSFTYIPPDSPVGETMLRMREGETGMVIAGDGSQSPITVFKSISRRVAA